MEEGVLAREFKELELHILLQTWTEPKLSEAELIVRGHHADSHGLEILKNFDGCFRRVSSVQRSQLGELYHDCDIFGFPALVERGPLVVLGALASVLPCVVSEGVAQS